MNSRCIIPLLAGYGSGPDYNITLGIWRSALYM